MTSIIWDNIGTSSVSQRVQLEKYLKFSIDYINSLLINPINFDVVASLYELDNEGTIAQASSDFLPLDGRGETYAQPGMIEAISGREVAGAIDAFVTFNATNLSDLFFDQTPWSGNDVPSLSIDAIAVTVHELLHTIGFMTFSDDLTGENPGYTVPMDRLIFAAPDGKIYFTGEEAIAEFGGPVPLAYGSLAHMGAPFDLGRD
ncbi:MAG TPA: hypothetical protein VGN98_04955, partial [Tianweitania sediminis]|nr:hypothetical protein [Tianweitania sediminis]